MKKDGVLHKAQKERSEKIDLHLAWNKSFALERMPRFCTLQASQMSFPLPGFKLSDRQDVIQGHMLGG